MNLICVVFPLAATPQLMLNIFTVLEYYLLFAVITHRQAADRLVEMQ